MSSPRQVGGMAFQRVSQRLALRVVDEVPIDRIVECLSVFIVVEHAAG